MAGRPSHRFHSPRSVILTKNGSYFSVSRWVATSCADLTEIGCSSEQPPNMTAIFNLAMLVPALEFQAVDDGVFHGVAQGVVRVIGGVRADEHVRQFLQPK